MSETPATDLPIQELTVVAPDPVDIASHPRLGERVSALSYARQTLAEQRKGFPNSSASTLRTPVKHLLKVGDWLLDDAHPDTSDTDEGPSEVSGYLVIRRPRSGMSFVVRGEISKAITGVLNAQGLEPDTRRTIIRALHEIDVALADEAHSAPDTPEAD